MKKQVHSYIVRAFEAVGGGKNKSGFIKKDKLYDILVKEFEMTIDLKVK